MILVQKIKFVGERMCANKVDVFYAIQKERPQRRVKREQMAKDICLSCANSDACREYARANRESFGVWGGETEYERFMAGFSENNPFRRQQRESRSWRPVPK